MGKKIIEYVEGPDRLQEARNSISVGKNIKWLRDRDGITLKELAKELKMPYNTLLQYENEKTYPKLDRLVQIAEYFQVSIELLVYGDD